MARSEWSASVKIKGPVSLARHINVNGISFRKNSKNIVAKCIVSADNPKNARDVAIRKINDILDTISYLSGQHVHIDGVLNLSSNSTGTADLSAGFTIRRLLNENELIELDRLNNILTNADTSDYSRALSYYRKGLGSSDPFDSFMSFFQSIEIVIRKFHGGSRASLNSLQNEFFLELGTNLHYNFDTYREMRNNIAHGSKSRDIDQIRLVSDQIDGIQTLACLILKSVIDKPTINEKVLHS